MVLKAPAGLPSLVDNLDAARLSADVFRQTGLFVVRQAVPPATVRGWQQDWDNFVASKLANGRNVYKFNPVQVTEPLSPELAAIPGNPALLDLAEQILGPDIALYDSRFVIKDKDSRGSVFLHSDYAYQTGLPSKVTFFIPLSDAGPENGGLVFYPGTHRFGHLGDAGEISADVLDPAWPTACPQLAPGDIVAMHCSLWHRSGPHVGGPDRIVGIATYQPADDPSSIALLRGQWRTEVFLKDAAGQKLFARSRSSRLVDLESQLTTLRGTQSTGE